MIQLFKITYLLKKTHTILQTAINILQTKRTMMAAKTQISYPTEIIQQKKIYALIFNQLRKGPLMQKDLLQLVDFSFIDMKSFQHIITVMFPHAQFPLEMVQEKYPNVSIGLDRTNSLSWNDLIATHAASYIKKERNFPFKGKLYVQGTPPYDQAKGDTSCNPEAIANTGQKNPDYRVFDESFGRRYFDLKAGQYSPMKGHIVLINNSDEFISATKNLMFHHLQYFTKFGLKFADIRSYIHSLLQDDNLDWATKSQNLHEFYFNNMHRLPNEMPSFIFECEPPYYANNVPYKDYEKFYVKTKSCATINDTRNVVVERLTKSSEMISDNYQKSHGMDITIYQKLKTEFITEVLETTLLG